MKAFVYFLLASQFALAPIYAQDTSGIKQNTTSSTQAEIKAQEVDSLVRFTRREFYQNNFDLTIEVGEEARKLAKEIEDYKSYFRLSSLIGNAFLKIEDTLQAKSVFTKAVTESQQVKSQGELNPDITEDEKYVNTRSEITARIDLGNFYALQDKAIPAIEIYTETLPIAKKIQDTTHLFILNFNIAELNLDNKILDKATFHVAETNRYINKSTRNPYRAVAKINDGRLALLNQQNQRAVNYLREGVALAKEANYSDALIEGYDVLSEALINQGNYKEAYDFRIQADSLRAEKYKTDKIQAIETVTAKYKLNEYQQEIKAKTLQNEINKEAARRETTILWIKIAAGILLISSIILFISYRKRKKLLVEVIDENKKYLAEKERSDELREARNALFSNITHELRTPMYGIIGISSVMMKDKNLKGHDENLGSLKFSANYLLSLINNVLQLTKVDSSKPEKLKRSKFKIRELVDQVVATTKFINTDHPNTYHVEIDNKVPETLISEDALLSQILINLVGNATKFTDNGTITIRVSETSATATHSKLRFEIEDTGVGISEENQKNLFNEFSRKYTEATEKQGTGLGLPIVKKLLSHYDSDVHLESTQGEGTKVSFELDFEKAPEVVEAPKPHYTNDILSNNTILVVDDNRINQLVTKKILESYGAQTMIASNGKDAIKMAMEHPLDLILMDINMPEMNGFEATEAIRAFNTTIPIVALTAVELEKVIGETRHTLMNDFIIKPYKNEVFIATLLKQLA